MNMKMNEQMMFWNGRMNKNIKWNMKYSDTNDFSNI